MKKRGKNVGIQLFFVYLVLNSKISTQCSQNRVMRHELYYCMCLIVG